MRSDNDNFIAFRLRLCVSWKLYLKQNNLNLILLKRKEIWFDFVGNIHNSYIILDFAKVFKKSITLHERKRSQKLGELIY